MRPGPVRGTAAMGTPPSAPSAGSSRRKTQRSPHAASIDGGISPGRSAVRTQAMPSPAPSPTIRVSSSSCSAPVGPSSAPRSAGTPSMASTTCGRSPALAGAAPLLELAHQPAQEAPETLRLVRPHDGAAVRKPDAGVQAVIASGVDDVDVEPRRRTFTRQRGDDGDRVRSSCPNRARREGRGDRRRAASARIGGTVGRGRRRCPRRRARASSRLRPPTSIRGGSSGNHGRWGGATSDSAAACRIAPTRTSSSLTSPASAAS